MNDDRYDGANATPSPSPAEALAMKRSQLRPGDVLSDRWLLGDMAGTGGAAVVFEATGLLGERAAIKTMRADALTAPGALIRFLREGLLARRIEHPAMVRALGDGTTDDGRPFLAFELLQGQSLEALGRRHPQGLPPAWLLDVIAPVLDLLSRCHEQGIVHRDVKPANVFVLRQGSSKLLDFGLAKARGLADDFLRPGVALGTPSFMSPEQAMGAWGQVDACSDVFSVGATLFALLSGSRLHAAKSEAEAFTRAATRAAPSLRDVAPDLPASIIELVDRALRWNKGSRFQNAGELLLALHTARAGIHHDAPINWAQEPVPSVVACELEPWAHKVTEACSLLDRLVRSSPVSSDACESVLRHASEHLQHAVADRRQALRLDVLPWGVRVGPDMVWTSSKADAPFPYALFEDGVRALVISPDASSDQLHRALQVLVGALRAEQGLRDGPVVALRQHGPLGLRLEVAATLVGDPDETPEQILDAIRIAGRLVGSARGIKVQAPHEPSQGAADRIARFAGEARLQRLRDAVQQARVSPDSLLVQALQALVEQARMQAPNAPVWDALGRAADDLLERGRPDLLLHALQTESRERGTMDAAGRLLRGARVGRLVVAAELLSRAPTTQVAGESLDTMLRVLLHEADASGVPYVLRDLRAVRNALIAREACAYVRRCGVPPFDVLLEVLPALSGEAGCELVSWIAELDGAQPRAVLEAVAVAAASALWLPATVQLCGLTSEAQVRAEALLASASVAERLLAMHTARSSWMRALAPALARHAQDPSFPSLGVRERQLTLDCLQRLAPATAEAVACALVRKHGLLRDDAFSSTRVLAASLLEQVGATQQSVGALRAAEVPIWWNPPEVREAALRARNAVLQRIRALAGQQA